MGDRPDKLEKERKERIKEGVLKRTGIRVYDDDVLWAMAAIFDLLAEDHTAKLSAICERMQDEVSAQGQQQVEAAKQAGDRLVRDAGENIARSVREVAKATREEFLADARALKAAAEEASRKARLYLVWTSWIVGLPVGIGIGFWGLPWAIALAG